MTRDGCRGFYWAGLPVIDTVARLLCRELTLVSEYLRLEDQVSEMQPINAMSCILTPPIHLWTLHGREGRTVSALL